VHSTVWIVAATREVVVAPGRSRGPRAVPTVVGGVVPVAGVVGSRRGAAGGAGVGPGRAGGIRRRGVGVGAALRVVADGRLAAGGPGVVPVRDVWIRRRDVVVGAQLLVVADGLVGVVACPGVVSTATVAGCHPEQLVVAGVSGGARHRWATAEHLCSPGCRKR